MLWKIEREKNTDTYTVYFDGRSLGRVETYRNPFHAQNCYLRFFLEQYEGLAAEDLFNLLWDAEKCPLQVMLSSTEVQLTDFLLACGFERKRRCWELEVKKTDLCAPGIGDAALMTAKVGMPLYDACCQLLYRQYAQSHAAVNPLTADFDQFCSNLPADTVCQLSEDSVRHFAFLEGNEIAYVGSTDLSAFPSFAQALAVRLFQHYDTLLFEADNCDAAAMALKSLFLKKNTSSFDTYIFSKK